MPRIYQLLHRVAKLSLVRRVLIK